MLAKQTFPKNSCAGNNLSDKIASKAMGKKFHTVDLELRKRNGSLRKKLYELTNMKPEEEPEEEAC